MDLSPMNVSDLKITSEPAQTRILLGIDIHLAYHLGAFVQILLPKVLTKDLITKRDQRPSNIVLSQSFECEGLLI